MKAKSIKGNSLVEIQSALQACREDGFAPTLAILFLSVSQNRSAVCALLQDAGLAIFGATTNGEFIDEELGKESIALLLLDMEPAHFAILFDEYPERNYRAVAQALARKAAEKFERPAFLLAGSNMATDAEQLLFGFEDILGKEVNVFGGMAGDDYHFTEQFVFTNNASSSNGVVVLVLDESKIAIGGRATCGWKPVGTERIVTKSEGNHVFTVDGQSVLDLTARYGGIENVTPENKDLMLEIATNFPLQLQREAGDPVMRPGLLIDWENRAFYCSGSVPEGSRVRFSLPADFDVMEIVVAAAAELKASEMPEADAVIVFSCGGRLVALGPLMNLEIEGLKNIWNAPMAGMFSNGELGRATGGKLEFHNLTTCVVALKEK